MNFRLMSEHDLLWFITIRNQVREMLHNTNHFSLEEAKSWFPSADSQYWIIELESTNIGYFRVKKIDSKSALIGADLAPEFQGKGLGLSAYKCFMSEILIPSGIENLELRVLKKNHRAINLYLKLGFQVVSETDIDLHMETKVIKLD